MYIQKYTKFPQRNVFSLSRGLGRRRIHRLTVEFRADHSDDTFEGIIETLEFYLAKEKVQGIFHGIASFTIAITPLQQYNSFCQEASHSAKFHPHFMPNIKLLQKRKQ